MSIKQTPSRRKASPLHTILKIRFQRLLSAFFDLFKQSRKALPPPATKPRPQRRRTKAVVKRTPPKRNIKAPKAMAKTKDTPFKAYDLRRKHLHTITEGSGGNPAPSKVTTHRVVRSDWAVTKPVKATRSSPRKTKKPASKTASLAVGSLLLCDDEETMCHQCGLFADDSSCGPKCYKAFVKANDASDSVEIRGPGKHGYGAFTKPGVTLKKGQILGEYLAQLVPLDVSSDSLYRFEIPGKLAIDAGPCGNWTRFVNSSCRPNVGAWTDTVGKRHIVFFETMREIGPEEELCFQYGKNYFVRAGFQCDCGAMKRPHMPGEAKTKVIKAVKLKK